MLLYILLFISVLSVAAQSNSSSQDSISIYQDLAIQYAEKGEAKSSVAYIVKYMSASSDMSILNDHVFSNIKDSKEYLSLKETYAPKFNWLSLLYFYAGFLGFYIFLITNLKKGRDRVGSLLIGLFLLFHSIFILHLSIYVVNVQYSLPHTLFLSTSFTFLYGPLLYFYLKRSMNGYQLKWKDSIHLVPSLILILYITPYYMMGYNEKFLVMFDSASFLLPGAKVIITAKISILIFYAIMIIRLLRNQTKSGNSSRNVWLWYRNIISIYCIYIVAYVFYAGSIVHILEISWLFHLQIMAMVAVVFYVSYMAYVKPEVFKGTVKVIDPVKILKYKKSGLTPSFSEELKEELIFLLEEEKIYRENDINLEKLSKKLDTTRHNTSQIINEHFNLNFFELINRYRIGEALELLQNERENNLNIIDIAYQVGFNNKVTFNKSFKKIHSQTPSQFLATL